jgi:hypothetical protein
MAIINKVKTIILAVGMICCCQAQTTNIQELLNVELTPQIVQDFPRRDATSPECVFLGFFRGAFLGDYKDFLFHFTDSNRLESAGTTNLDAISEAYTHRFLANALTISFTNIMLKSFCLTNMQGHTRIISDVYSKKGILERTEPYILDLTSTNETWKIETFHESDND